MFDGELVDFNDYDMVILPSGPYSISDDCKCASIAGDNIIIDREAIAWMKTIDRYTGGLGFVSRPTFFVVFNIDFFCDTVAQEGCPNTIDWCGSSGYMGMEHSKNFPPRFSYPPKEESSSIWSHKQKKDNLPNIGKVVFSFQVDTTANSQWRASCVV